MYFYDNEKAIGSISVIAKLSTHNLHYTLN